MEGVIYSILAGAAMSVQGVMNTRLGEGIGTMEAGTLVQGTAFALSALALAFYHRGSFAALGGVNRLYWLGGVLGVVITVPVMLGIKALSPGVSISIILISQLPTAGAIDGMGLMGSQRGSFGWTKFAGLALMICGVLLFKWTKQT